MTIPSPRPSIQGKKSLYPRPPAPQQPRSARRSKGREFPQPTCPALTNECRDLNAQQPAANATLSLSSHNLHLALGRSPRSKGQMTKRCHLPASLDPIPASRCSLVRNCSLFPVSLSANEPTYYSSSRGLKRVGSTGAGAHPPDPPLRSALPLLGDVKVQHRREEGGCFVHQIPCLIASGMTPRI